MIEDLAFLRAEKLRSDAGHVIRAAIEDLRDLDFDCRYSLTIRDTIARLEDAQESLIQQTHGIRPGIARRKTEGKE